MDPRTQERVERWDARPFSGGLDGLSSLSDADFSGGVSAGGAWLFMLNGRIVGVIDGTLEQFEEASGTAYVAPHPSLPLLCTMVETGGDTRAKYYTNDTAIREVDQTLQSGSFTGYLVLSEQVLSGDYYLVYYGGRRMAAAYIGNAERLLTGEEAFERADDEVGIYEVVDVDLEVQDVPSQKPDTVSASTAGEAPSTANRNDPNEGGPDQDLASDVQTQDQAGERKPPEADEPTTTSELAAQRDHVSEPADQTEQVTKPDVSGGQTASASDKGDAPTTKTSPDRTPNEDEAGEKSERMVATEPVDEPNTPGEEDTETPTAQPMPPAEPDESSPSSSGPDPEEIEAAAAELGKDGVPWVDESTDADTRDSSTEDEPAAAIEAEESDPNPEPDPEEEPQSTPTPREERFKQEARWRETRQIPSIDPEKSSSSDSGRASSNRSRTQTDANRSITTSEAHASSTRPQQREPAGRNRKGITQSDAETASDSNKGQRIDTTDRQARTGTASGSTQSRPTRSPASNSRDTLEEDMLEREDKIDQLTQRVDDLEETKSTLEARATELEQERDLLAEERDGYREEAAELSTTVDRLREQIETLEAELQQVRQAREADVPVDGTQMNPRDALSQTNLFVRYESKSQPTLASAHDGEGNREAVTGNLRIEHHTQFDADSVVVDGQSFESYLQSTMEYQFVTWLTETLLFEIRDTGRDDGLSDLYDTLPRIDRIELQAAISLADDDTEGVPEEVTFDVVVFDKRGHPLIAANLNDSREPASEAMLEDLERTASAVKANYPELGGAIVVTSSFFEPGALEVAEQATQSGGFLSRDARLSYVSLSRKLGGYHLCLVEARSGGFHMTVPEL